MRPPVQWLWAFFQGCALWAMAVGCGLAVVAWHARRRPFVTGPLAALEHAREANPARTPNAATTWTRTTR